MISSKINNLNSYISKIVEVQPVTKVGKGRKLLRFRVCLIMGNKSGIIGFGTGKDKNFFNSKLKGIEKAKKNLIELSLTDHKTITSGVTGKFRSAFIILKPAKSGTGLRAGNTIRTIFELAGITNIIAKQLGSCNILNNVVATFLALQSI
uniref:Ribosomal protein S5 n=1 Tax=Pteridomonas danica TaxID=38822 RepID=A0A7T1C5C6_9STRA|nr:ribosomal protein S5 [Pteridomonas danica]QPM99312.1 ribosomal protein S5 [Pteridomonas danica]